MTTNLDRFTDELESLIDLGRKMLLDIQLRSRTDEELRDSTLKAAQEKFDGVFDHEYQNWYTSACAVVGQLIPNRLNEFESLYRSDPKIKEWSSFAQDAAGELYLISLKGTIWKLVRK